MPYTNKLFRSDGGKSFYRTYAPEYPQGPPPKLELPLDHPCHGCAAIDQNNAKPFCFLPKCRREDYEKCLGIEHDVFCSSGAEREGGR